MLVLSILLHKSLMGPTGKAITWEYIEKDIKIVDFEGNETSE